MLHVSFPLSVEVARCQLQSWRTGAKGSRTRCPGREGAKKRNRCLHWLVPELCLLCSLVSKAGILFLVFAVLCVRDLFRFAYWWRKGKETSPLLNIRQTLHRALQCVNPSSHPTVIISAISQPKKQMQKGLTTLRQARSLNQWISSWTYQLVVDACPCFLVQ